MVATSQVLATEAGLEILRKGGNAADAAVATAAAMNVCEPNSTGIGGDAFCLHWNAKRKEMRGINGSGKSPKGMTLAKAKELGFDKSHGFLPVSSAHSILVPGTAATWVDTVNEFGSGKLSLSEVLEPAARLAEEGVPIFEIAAANWATNEAKLKRASPNSYEMLVPDGNGKHRAPRAGEIKVNAGLAKTLRTVGKEGRDGFYKGRVASAIVDLCQSQGSTMTLEDLDDYQTLHVDPISYSYQDEVTLHECPPNGQGLAALIALGIIDVLTSQGKINLETMEHNSSQYLHILVEAIRLAFADARAFISDPESARIAAKDLLSKEYLLSRAELFDPARAADSVTAGQPIAKSDTIYLATADNDGNTCSFIQSNYQNFGHGGVPAGCGFTLNNRGTTFVLEEGHPNCLEGGKRPFHTIIPAMATRKGEHFLTFGVMGGFMQPQGHLQVLMNILHRHFTIQHALDVPRFCVGEGFVSKAGSHRTQLDIINIEDGIDADVVKELRSMGHHVEIIRGAQRALFGRGQVIMSLHDTQTGRHVWAGASDPRGDGCAAPQI